MTAKISKKLSNELKNIESTGPDEMAAAIEKSRQKKKKENKRWAELMKESRDPKYQAVLLACIYQKYLNMNP